MDSLNNKPKLSAVVAMATNRVIGNQNSLPWHLPADLKHFKNLTIGHTIIMGRKTYESIGKPLPNRRNFILTRDAHYQAPGCTVVTSIDDALKQCANEKEIFIIGGADIYKQLLPAINKIYLTIIHHEFVGDAFFPELDEREWHEETREDHQADEVNQYGYSFITLSR